MHHKLMMHGLHTSYRHLALFVGPLDRIQRKSTALKSLHGPTDHPSHCTFLLLGLPSTTKSPVHVQIHSASVCAPICCLLCRLKYHQMKDAGCDPIDPAAQWDMEDCDEEAGSPRQS